MKKKVTYNPELRTHIAHARLNDEEWEQFFMGDDATFTYYLDAVDRTFSRSSLTSREDRYPIDDKTVNEMFKIIREQK